MFSTFKSNPRLLNQLKTYIERHLISVNEMYYAYTVINKQNPLETLIISSYPEEWVDIYRDNNYQLIDPVILNSFRRSSPFLWGEDLTLMSSKIFALSSHYSIINGLTFMLHDPANNLALLSVTLPAKYSSDLAVGRAELQMVLIDINEQMYSLEKAYKNSSPLLLKGKTVLSLRENEILWWASKGKTYSDISLITGISSRTVKYHMANAVTKLGARNARHAIGICTESGLIVPVS